MSDKTKYLLRISRCVAGDEEDSYLAMLHGDCQRQQIIREVERLLDEQARLNKLDARIAVIECRLAERDSK